MTPSSSLPEVRKRPAEQDIDHSPYKRPRTFWDTVLSTTSCWSSHPEPTSDSEKIISSGCIPIFKPVSAEPPIIRPTTVLCTSPLSEYARSSSPPPRSHDIGNKVIQTVQSNPVKVSEARESCKTHSCELCQATFARSSHLRLHVRTIHEKLKPFRCGECSATFGHISSKYRHFRTVHLKRRDFSCSKCGQTFAERSAVQKHCRTVHEGSRPYPCPICGFRFHFKLHLTQHIATVHDKLRPHACKVCHARFGQRSSLNRHARQIHGEVISRVPQSQRLPTADPAVNSAEKVISVQNKVSNELHEQTGPSQLTCAPRYSYFDQK